MFTGVVTEVMLQQQVEFKRRIDQELRLRELISRSVVIPTVEEHVYCEDDLLIEENREKFIEESTAGRERQLHQVVQVGLVYRLIANRNLSQ